MKPIESVRKIFAAAAVFGLALSASGLALAGPPEGEGWVSLFNGEDLTGWTAPEGDNGHWKVLDGVIDYDSQSEAAKDKNLRREKEQRNFTCHTDWRRKKTTGISNKKR